MAGEMMLRDHSRPCEHIRESWKQFRSSDGWSCDSCPGGAPIEVDYEAASKAYYANHDTGSDHVRAVVNAALGIVEVDDE